MKGRNKSEEAKKKSKPTEGANAAKASRHTKKAHTEAHITKEIYGIQIESIGKNTLRELHHTKEQFIEANTKCFTCQQCAESFKSINEMHIHALGFDKDNLSLNHEDE